MNPHSQALDLPIDQKHEATGSIRILAFVQSSWATRFISSNQWKAARAVRILAGGTYTADLDHQPPNKLRQQIYLRAGIFTGGYIWMGPKISEFDIFGDSREEWEARRLSLSLLLTSRQIRLEVQSMLWSNNVVVCRAINPGDLLPLRQLPRTMSSLKQLVIYYSGPTGSDDWPLCRWASSFAPPWNLPKCNNHGIFKARIAVDEFSETFSEILRNKRPYKLELGLVLGIDDDYRERT